MQFFFVLAIFIASLSKASGSCSSQYKKAMDSCSSFPTCGPCLAGAFLAPGNKAKAVAIIGCTGGITCGNTALFTPFRKCKSDGKSLGQCVRVFGLNVDQVNTATTSLVETSDEIPHESNISFVAMLGVIGLAMIATYKVAKDYRHRHHLHSKQYNKLDYESLTEA